MDSIKTIREQLHLTQEKMAERLGITRNYLALIETGRRSVPPKVKEALETICNNLPEANRLPHDNQVVDKLLHSHAELVARMDSLDARLATIEQLLLRLVADGGAKTGG